jgi:hypothetical protein
MARLFLVLVSLLALRPQEKNPPTLGIGAPAPDFDVPGVDGKRYALKDFAGRKLLLVLFDTVHCPTSQNYAARIRKIHEDYKDRGVGFIVISPSHPKALRLDELGYTDLDDSFESMKLRAKDKAYAFPFCYDGEPNTASQAYGPKATPHAFLFDADRKLRYQGGIDDNEWEDRAKAPHLRNALDALLEGKPVPVEKTNVFGCSTKWPNKQPSVEKYNEDIAREPVTIAPGGAEALREARKNDSGNVRLIHVWSTAAASRLPSHIVMYHMYRRRNFSFVTVAVDAADKKDAVLAALKASPPAGAHERLPGKVTHLVLPDLGQVREALDAGWDGRLPFTLVVGATNEVLYKQSGDIDDLEVKRAVVRHLKEDRRR